MQIQPKNETRTLNWADIEDDDEEELVLSNSPLAVQAVQQEEEPELSLVELINSLKGKSYSESVSIIKTKIYPRLMVQIQQTTEWDGWNEVEKTALHQFMFDIFSVKMKNIPKFSSYHLDRIFQHMLTSLIYSRENTEMLSKPQEWCGFTFLEKCVRHHYINAHCIRLLIEKHMVDVDHIGGKIHAYRHMPQFAHLESWNENACFLLTREWLRTWNNDSFQVRYANKMFTFIRCCMSRRIRMRPLFEVKSIGENNQSALDLIQLESSQQVINSEQSVRVKGLLVKLGLI